MSLTACCHVFNKEGIEIERHHFFDFLKHNACAESIASAGLGDAQTSGEHLCDELVAREDESEASRVVMPDLIGHETEPLKPCSVLQIECVLVLWLSGRLRAHDDGLQS